MISVNDLLLCDSDTIIKNHWPDVGIFRSAHRLERGPAFVLKGVQSLALRNVRQKGQRHLIAGRQGGGGRRAFSDGYWRHDEGGKKSMMG